jgi:LPPG:FO 2-phospho-L-lactate transferase
VKVALLAGGGGGARFARGLDAVLAPGELTVVANVGDDLEILGLDVSPDLDSLLYTLGGLIDSKRGWGRAEETWNALESVSSWGGEDWFRLGDRDLGLHLVRTTAVRKGATLSTVTAELSGRAGLKSRILPATNGRLRTHVVTPAGRFAFQEWFVARAHRDEVDTVEYDGADVALPAPGVVEAIAAADAIVLAPSNPYLSIGPILAVAEIRGAIEKRRARCVAVSPIIGGAAVTGPAGNMLTRMAGGATPGDVASCYKGLVDALVIDKSDAPATADVELIITDTRMRDPAAEQALAGVVLEAACR